MIDETGTPSAEAAPLDILTSLSQFDGTPAAFLAQLLQVQCSLAGARAGAMLALPPSGPVRVIVQEPPAASGVAPASWLAHAADAARDVVKDGEPTTRAVHSAPGLHAVLIPIRGAAGSHAVLVFAVAETDGDLAAMQERLVLLTGLLALYDMRVQNDARAVDLARLRDAMETLAATNEQSRMGAAAIALCNELAARWDAERVAFGVLRGRYVRLAALSHTERFDRKMRLVQDIESAMEECLDQDVEVLFPPPDGAAFVSRCAEELSRRHGPAAIISVPLRRDGTPQAVLLLERRAEAPFDSAAITGLRLTAELVTARMLELHTHDRWVGARIARELQRAGAALVGPRHTWAKLTAAGVILVALLLVFVKGPDRVDAPFEVQAVELRRIPAPFAGRITSVGVTPGDTVVGGETALAALDTAELRLRLAAARAERASFLKEADLALREDEQAQVQIAEANRNKVEAEIRLLEHQIEQATLTAPISGTVVRGDLDQEIGAPVETGDVLFEIAQLEDLRAVIEVPEDRIHDLAPPGADLERRGTLASVAHPGDYLPFVVEHVNPIAEVVDDRNVFRVEVRFLEERPWLKPGMTGVAKVDVGRRPYAVLWTRRLVDWVRMKLWI